MGTEMGGGCSPSLQGLAGGLCLGAPVGALQYRGSSSKVFSRTHPEGPAKSPRNPERDGAVSVEEGLSRRTHSTGCLCQASGPQGEPCLALAILKIPPCWAPTLTQQISQLSA